MFFYFFEIFKSRFNIGVISSMIFADTGTVVQAAVSHPLFFASSSIISIVYLGLSVGNIERKKDERY